MIVKSIPPIRILLSVYKLAKKTLNETKHGRGRRGYKLATRISTVAFLIIYNLTLERAEKELKETGLYKRLGAKKPPDYTTICKWKKKHIKEVRRLIRETFYKLMGFKNIKNLTAITDGTGFKNHKYSSYYDKRLKSLKKRKSENSKKPKKAKKKKTKKKANSKKSKKKPRRGFTRVVLTYALEVDAIFEITVTPSHVGEKTAFMNGHLADILSAKIFGSLVADKLYDSTDLIEALAKGGIEPCIPAREGKLKPEEGPRKAADENYQRLIEEKGNVRSLVESCISSMKAFKPDYVRSREQEGKEMEILMLALFYNVARLCSLNLI